MHTEVAPDIHDITTREDEHSRHRVYLLDADVPTLFDTSWPDTTEALAAGVASVGLEPERLVVTHGDDDHIGAYDFVVDTWGVETWVPEATDRDDLGAEPDHRYVAGDTVAGFEAVSVPGHTDDSHAWVDEDRGVAILGDTVMGADRRGLPAGYLISPPAVFSTDLDAAERNLDRLIAYDFDVGLVYHGTSVTEAASERLASFVDFPGRP